MAKEPESFDELIDAIAEGTAVDWSAVARAGRVDPRQLEAARAIAGLHHSPGAPPLPAGSEPASADLAQGFERLEELGHGAFGRVWRARDRALGREVALKVLEHDRALSSEQRALFVREARLLAACEHENIVRIHSIEEREGSLELCLELLDGTTLEQLVREGGPLSAGEAARIGADLCRALAALHSRGLVHRDVKPANVMRVRGGRIVLLDFGLAHAADVAQARATTGGTPLFMAPELLNGGDFDGRVDLYSLGVTLYWLVTAQWPYESTSRDELFEKIEREPPIPLIDRRPDLPHAFVATVERALARDPRRRFASAGEMEAALQSFLSARMHANRRRSLATFAAAALLVVAAALAWRWRPIRPELTVGLGVLVSKTAPPEFRPLADGATLRKDDHLLARLTLHRDAWVYGFNFDRRDRCYVAFPLPFLTLTNPLPAGTSQLPGRDEREVVVGWGINGEGLEESYVFFISAEPVPELQALWERCPKPELTSSGAPIDAGTRTSDKATPLGAAASADSGRDLIASLERYADERAAAAGVVVRSVRFKSDGR